MEIELDDKKPKITLSGINGNAYSIMGVCHKAWQKAGRLETKWKEIQQEMTSGNYDHLLQTAMKYFEVS